MLGKSLSQKRSEIENQWGRFSEGLPIADSDPIDTDILSSWHRSRGSVSAPSTEAPLDKGDAPGQSWESSPLSKAVIKEKHTLEQLAKEGSLVAAISNPEGRLLWTAASSHMRRRAESVNFIAGGRWDEASVGTNAIGLSLELRRPVTVFSSEHYLPVVRDWVCYAAPIIHPKTQECLGVLDMSTTWKRHTPLGPAAVNGLAQSIAMALPEPKPQADLEIYGLGNPRVVYQGKPVYLPRRQIEILCLLALYPQGMSLERLHAALYGDSPVSTSTLKAELSHLRRLLGGKIGSRPYRLEVSVWADFLEIWRVVQNGHSNKALGLYAGSLLPQSQSPELEDWRHCIDAVMSRSLEDCDDVFLLMDSMCSGNHGHALVRDRLSELMSAASN